MKHATGMKTGIKIYFFIFNQGTLKGQQKRAACCVLPLIYDCCTIFGILSQYTIHYGNLVTSGTSIFGIYQHMIPNRSKHIF